MVDRNLSDALLLAEKKAMREIEELLGFPVSRLGGEIAQFIRLAALKGAKHGMIEGARI